MSALLERQKGFASDASHQLRTPLTALRIRLEQAEELSITDPVASQSRLQSALAEADRLQQMVDGLLALARSEGSAGKIVYLDLNTLVIERIAAWRALADESNIELRLLAETSVVVQAIPNAVEQIIDNFIDNALEYAPDGSSIDISISQRDNDCIVVVSDRGPGLTEEQCVRALDRFWRAPDAASGGTGLGLTIAAGLAEMSLGTVELHPRIGGGLDATLILTVATN
jgi:signal transduction histidine kinase